MPSSTGCRMPTTWRKVLMFSSDRGKALTQRLNSLALSQEEFIAENYGDKATAELKRAAGRADREGELNCAPSRSFEGWVERSETHRLRCAEQMMGFAAL